MTGKREDDDFDSAMDELQKTIERKERETYSIKVIDESRFPSNFGMLNEASTESRVTGTCGDTMEIALKIDDGQIVNAKFFTDGCGATVACGSMLTKLVKGSNLEEAWAVTPEILTSALDGLPPENLHCSALAVETLRKALDDYADSMK